MQNDGFHEIVQGSAKLRRACGVEDEGTREATEGDMRTMWKAFAKYVEADGRDAGEMPTRNLGVITRQEGRRSKLEWKIETEQDVFYGGSVEERGVGPRAPVRCAVKITVSHSIDREGLVEANLSYAQK